MKKIVSICFFVFVIHAMSTANCDTAYYIKVLNTFPSKGSFEVKRDFVREIYDSLKHASVHQQTYCFLSTASNYFNRRGETLMECISLNYLGLFYNNIGKYNDATQTFSKAIAKLEKFKPKEDGIDGKQSVLYLIDLNYGNTFYFLNDANRALSFYKKALIAIKKKSKLDREDSLKMAQVYNNFGITYSMKNDQETGLYYFNKALSFNIGLRDSSRIANVLSNLASLHSNRKEIDSALSKYFLVKEIYERGGNAADISFINSEIASVYLNTGKAKLALPYALKSLSYCDTNAYSPELVSTYNIINLVFKELKDYKNEAKYLRLYMTALDSVNSVEALSEINKREMILEFNAQRITDSVKGVEEIKRKDISLRAKKNQSYFLIALLIVTLIALSLIYSRFKLSQKQKSIIEKQKILVDEKNKEIMDSINYAKRIQNSLLPTEKYIDKTFKRLKDK